MELWFIIFILISISITLLTKSLLLHSNNKLKLPPGPPSIPIISSLIWFKSFSELEPILHNLRSKYGPLFTIPIGFRPAIFITTHSLAHQALVQNGSVFADRPPALPLGKVITSNQHNISSAFYGPTWRLLRRNLTSGILHPSRLKSFSKPRKWVLDILIKSLTAQHDHVVVKDHFQYAMFCLLVFMCFGEKLEEDKIKEVEKVQCAMLLSFNRFNILNFWPALTRLLFRKRWGEFLQLRREQEEVLIPLIRARARARTRAGARENMEDSTDVLVSYVDTLIDLQLPEEKRKLEEGELVSLCSEFLTAGTDTTSTTLQWILANLVKYPRIQQKLFEEILGVVGAEEEEIKEEDLQKMPYLKAVILEGLRRHPPGHFVLPHAVTEDTFIEGFFIPKNAIVNFMVAEMGLDPKVWENPLAFKPERFLNDDNNNNEIDITGSREIKMMPFGVGRRICPGYSLAILHLEYYVANLIWKFKWTAVDGDDVDLSEKQEFTVVMKNPLKAHLSPRINP